MLNKFKTTRGILAINKSNMKGFIAGVITTSILSLSIAAFADSIEKQISVAYNNIKIVVDGQAVSPKDSNGNTVEPFIYSGTVYLPVRAVAQALGESVSWNDDSKTVTLTSQGGQGNKGGNMQDPAKMTERLKTVLSNLVSAGTLTQEKADKVLAYFESNTNETAENSTTQDSEPAERIDPLTQAVNDGVITQTEADAIKSVMMPSQPGGQTQSN